MVERVLAIVNRESGLGGDPGLPAALLRELRASCGPVREVELALVSDHAAARLATRTFIAGMEEPAAVIVGGGGGTLRAAVEGVWDEFVPDLPPRDRVVIGALRMGSGNVVARRLGIPRDPIEGIRGLGASLRERRSTPVAVIRARFGTSSRVEDVRHAVTMCGLGQWGRTSGDLARWHRALPKGRAAMAAVAGLEGANHLEYVGAAGLRLLEAAVRPQACEHVEISHSAGCEAFRLLAGVVMNFRIGGMPFDPGVEPGEVAAGAVLIPRGGLPRRLRLVPGEDLRIRLLDRDSIEFFLDEDPEIAHGSITVGLAGALAFLPGQSMEVA